MWPGVTQGLGRCSLTTADYAAWCADYRDIRHVIDRDVPLDNPPGPDHGMVRVMRAGRYLCHDSYGNRYRVATRSSNEPDASSGILGFRCVRLGRVPAAREAHQCHPHR
jgi:hypothetical protein